VRTTLKELPAAHRIEFHQEVLDQAGQLLTIGKTVLYFIDAKTREKTVLPAAIQKKLSTYFI
jgi:acyl-CoA thioester hydrolase